MANGKLSFWRWLVVFQVIAVIVGFGIAEWWASGAAQQSAIFRSAPGQVNGANLVPILLAGCALFAFVCLFFTAPTLLVMELHGRRQRRRLERERREFLSDFQRRDREGYKVGR